MRRTYMNDNPLLKQMDAPLPILILEDEYVGGVLRLDVDDIQIVVDFISLHPEYRFNAFTMRVRELYMKSKASLYEAFLIDFDKKTISIVCKYNNVLAR